MLRNVLSAIKECLNPRLEQHRRPQRPSMLEPVTQGGYRIEPPKGGPRPIVSYSDYQRNLERKKQRERRDRELDAWQEVDFILKAA